MDILSEVLQTMKLQGTLYFDAKFQAPWGMSILQGEYANFHIVTDGECLVNISQTNKQIVLRKGDMILFPKGSAHSLADSVQSDIVNADELLQKTRRLKSGKTIYGGDGVNTVSLICGHFEYDKEYSHPLFDTLPLRIYLSSQNDSTLDWFTTTSELVVQLSQGNSLGKKIIVDKLAESLFLQILSKYIESLDYSSSFLIALQDINIGLALNAMHENITHSWTIDELSKIASMSKSLFSTKFSQMVGEPPIVYLAKWRMIKARELLINTNKPLSQISELVGYQSEFSFSKAFKKMTGMTSGSLRIVS